MSSSLVTLFTLAGSLSLGLAALMALLLLILHLANVQRVTMRIGLGAAWLVTLAAPALAWTLVIGASAVAQSLRDSTSGPPPFPLPTPAQFQVAQIVAPVFAFLGVMVFVAWMTGRLVLRPLAAMRQAARRIADGDLEVTLAAPPLREIAEVAEAFSAMSGALRASIERQAEIEQQRRLFISAVAHDLRTPLFSLRGYLEGLQRGLASSPEKADRYLAICQRQADTLERLVSDLFAYARLEYLEDAPASEPLDLAALVRLAVESARPQADEKGVALAVETLDAPCPALGESHQLLRALENLLDNALRYTPSGGEARVVLMRAPHAWRVAVADTGPGIAPDDLPYLFEPLYRGEVSRNRATGGAGLGLAIARRIIRAHGGELIAANGAVNGAIFTATLPALIEGQAASA